MSAIAAQFKARQPGLCRVGLEDTRGWLRPVCIAGGGILLAFLLGCSGQGEPAALSPEISPPPAAPPPTASSAAAKPAWLRSPLYNPKADAPQLIADAVKEASRTHRRVLVQWGHNLCIWCYRLHDLFEADPETRRLLQVNYVYVPVDSGNSGLAAALGTRLGSLPSLTILDGTGQPLGHQETDSLRVGGIFDTTKVQAVLNRWSASSGDPGAASPAPASSKP